MVLYPCQINFFFSCYRTTGELLQEYRGHTNKVSLHVTKSGYSTFKCSSYIQHYLLKKEDSRCMLSTIWIQVDIQCHQYICIFGILLLPIPEACFSSVLSNFSKFNSNFLTEAFAEIRSFILNYPQSYKLDCCLTNTDAHVTGGSEDGFVYFWDLVDASVVSKFRAHALVVISFYQFTFQKKAVEG